MCLQLCISYIVFYIHVGSRDSSVGTAMGYGLDSRGSIPGRGRDTSLPHGVQACSGAHPASYPSGTGGSYSEGKATGAQS
jgi:hypothetical protein